MKLKLNTLGMPVLASRVAEKEREPLQQLASEYATQVDVDQIMKDKVEARSWLKKLLRTNVSDERKCHLLAVALVKGDRLEP